MANFTAKAIKATFLELLDEHPLSDITVKDIVEACGINRNSFYYHYQDIPALLEEIIKEESEKVIEKYPSVSTMVECYDAVTEFASSRKKAIMHIYKSSSRESFEKKLLAMCEFFITRFVEENFSGTDINSETVKIEIHFYKCVIFGLVLDWLNSGMGEEGRASVRKVLVAGKEHASEFSGILHGK